MTNPNVSLLCGDISAKSIHHSVCIVVDVLRATSTVVTALSHGYKKIIPISDLNKLKSTDISSGEELGERQSCATFGNSPTEIITKPVTNDTLYLKTTNGTRCLLQVDDTNYVLIGSILNGYSVAEAAYKIALKHNRNIVILCSGYHNKLEDDDLIAASFVASKLHELGASIQFSTVTVDNIQHDILSSAAALRLTAIGYHADVIFCSSPNKFSIVPYYYSQSIQLEHDYV